MKRTALLPLLLALVLPSGALAAPPAPPRLVEPAQDAVVPLLNETQRGYVLMPREERVNAYTNEAFRRALRDGGEVPAKVRFAWKGTAPEGEGPAFTVEVRRKPDGKVFFRGGTDHHHLAADGCFEIAREWEWTVRARGGASTTPTRHRAGSADRPRARRRLRDRDVPHRGPRAAPDRRRRRPERPRPRRARRTRRPPRPAGPRLPLRRAQQQRLRRLLHPRGAARGGGRALARLGGHCLPQPQHGFQPREAFRQARPRLRPLAGRDDQRARRGLCPRPRLHAGGNRDVPRDHARTLRAPTPRSP